MGTILEEIRDEFLPESARGRKSLSMSSQTERGDEVMKTPHHDGGSKAGDQEVSEEQATIMNKHLSEMSEHTLKSMMKCLKSSNSSPEIQKLVLIRLGEISTAE